MQIHGVGFHLFAKKRGTKFRKRTGIFSGRGKDGCIFVTVDKSPHCVQLHYVVKELENIMDLKDIKIKNYVATSDGLIEIPIEVIGLSKNLAKLKEKLN